MIARFMSFNKPGVTCSGAGSVLRSRGVPPDGGKAKAGVVVARDAAGQRLHGDTELRASNGEAEVALGLAGGFGVARWVQRGKAGFYKAGGRAMISAFGSRGSRHGRCARVLVPPLIRN